MLLTIQWSGMSSDRNGNFKLVVTPSGQDMAISHLLTSSGQEWHFNMATVI